MEEYMKPTGNQILYLLTIRKLSEIKHVVRSVDVARLLDYSRASVHKMLGSLKEMDCIEQEYYGSIKLTAKGLKKADEYQKKYQVLADALAGVIDMPDNYLLGICNLIELL